MSRKPGVFATLIALLVMARLSLWAAPNLPAEVAVHVDASGQPDGYASPTFALVVTPLFTLGLAALLFVIPLIEPRRRHLEVSAKPYNAVWVAVAAFMTLVHGAILLNGLGRAAPVGRLLLVGTGVLLVVVGAYLGKVRSNWFMGVRTPWTLSSERSWTLTHRLAGRLLLALGALVSLAAVLAPLELGFRLIIGGVVAVAVVTSVYSWLVWRNDPIPDASHPTSSTG